MYRPARVARLEERPLATSYYIRAFDNQADHYTEIFLEIRMLSHKILNKQ